MAAFERLHGLRDQRGGDRREGRDPQFARDRLLELRQFGLRFLQNGDDALGMRHQALAGLGQPHATAAPLDQRESGLGLQQRDLLRHRRGRDAQSLRHRRHGLAQRELAQGTEPGDVHAQLCGFSYVIGNFN